MDKFNIQNNLYKYFYHYIPYVDENSNAKIYRNLNWGYEYLCYMLYVKSIIERISPKSILDIGCGDGRLFSLLECNARKVGVDLSGRAIILARALNDGCEFHNSNVSDINETFELVSAIEVLEHIPDNNISKFIENVTNKIVDQGFFVISVPTKNIPLNKKHYRHYDFELLLEHVLNNSKKLKLVEHNFVYYRSKLLKLYLRVTNNRLWFLDLKPLSGLVWKYIFKNKLTTPEKGSHLVAVFKNECS